MKMFQIKLHVHGQSYLGNEVTAEQMEEVMTGLRELFTNKLSYMSFNCKDGGNVMIGGPALEHTHIAFVSLTPEGF